MNKTIQLIPSLLILTVIPGLAFSAGADTLTIESDLNVQGALTVGDSEASVPQAGSIRWTGSDLEGFDGSEWKSLTQSSNVSVTDQILLIEGNELTISGTGGNTVILPAGIAGADGRDGTTWLTGSGVPDSADGADSDIYLDTGSGDYYVKASGAWGNPVGNLTGPQGIAGADGAIGPQGPDGASPFVLDGSNVHFTGGNVGIGVTTPGEALDVVGNAKISGQLTVAGSLALTEHQGDIPAITY